jgi:hypothetical protein
MNLTIESGIIKSGYISYVSFEDESGRFPTEIEPLGLLNSWKYSNIIKVK